MRCLYKAERDKFYIPDIFCELLKNNKLLQIFYMYIKNNCLYFLLEYLINIITVVYTDR
jgi:hypothetical protein